MRAAPSARKRWKNAAQQGLAGEKPHETALAGGLEFFAGAPAALRCEVHGVKSYAETVPLPAASVKVQLVADTGKGVTLYEGKTGADGVADVAFPGDLDLPAGKYKMQVVTRSDLGEEKLEREVQIKTAPKVLLVTDKPLYQPGQLMHLRALALQSFDLKPVAAAELTFEVEDAKGNKVFKPDIEVLQISAWLPPTSSWPMKSSPATTDCRHSPPTRPPTRP